MTPILIISIYLLLLTLAATNARANTKPTGAQIARQIVATWQCQDQLGQPRTPARNPWNLARHSPAFRAWLLNSWRLRRSDCREELGSLRRQWNWQQWLPDKWRRIAVCETGLNWRHYNSSYEGAFGFATGSWDQFKPDGYPDHASQATPWEQYQVALAIYRRYGFSGWGCRGA